MEFRRALLRVASEIGPRDLTRLKFACSDNIPDARQERIHTAIELFLALEERGLLSPDNLSYLARQLRDIGRKDALSHFIAFGFSVPDPSDPSDPKSSSAGEHSVDSPIEERLTKFLLLLSDRLSSEEIDRLSFAWCKTYLQRTPDQIYSAYQLFTLMTQRMAITAENLDILYMELNEMGRQDLCRMVDNYYAKNGINHQFYVHAPSPYSHIPSPALSTPSNGNVYPRFSPERLSPSTRPTDLSLSSTSSSPSRESRLSVDHNKPVGVNQPHRSNAHIPQQHRTNLEYSTGNTAMVGQLFEKERELRELKEMLEHEKSQRRAESMQSSSLVDQHQNQIIRLQKALDHKNHEIQELYREFLTQNMATLSLSSEADYYPMTCNPHGYCIIFNNYQFYQVENGHEQLMDRGGAEVDQTTLAETFKFLQYTVEVCENLSSQDMVGKMKEISSRDHSSFDSFICCILTHGEEGKVFGSNSLAINLQDLTGLVKGTYCPTLVNKPKLFFIQACRGEKEEKGVPMEKDGESSLPVEADYLFGYATPPGKAAYRSRRYGSWFISVLCETFTNNAHMMGLNAMMKRVNRSVSEAYTKEGYKQCTEVVDRLRSEVKFLPTYPPNPNQ